jgi:hypothetical protein
MGTLYQVRLPLVDGVWWASIHAEDPTLISQTRSRQPTIGGATKSPSRPERGTVVTKNTNPLVLNPDDDFEAVVIDILKMHRKKSAQYGTDADPLDNFTVGAFSTSSTPLRYLENLLAKHSGAIRNWFSRQPDHTVDPVKTAGSNDGYIDRAVYSIIACVLYRRSGG